MKKLFTLSKIHDDNNESNLFQFNIDPQFYEDIIRHSTICMNADIEEKYINVPVQFKGILFVLKQRVYIDTRTNIIYDHVESLDEKYSYYINMNRYQETNDDLIRHFKEFKPLGDEHFYRYEDHYKIYKEVMGEE